MNRMNGRYCDLATVGKITTKDKENGRIMRQYMSRTWINRTYILYNCIVWNISINYIRTWWIILWRGNWNYANKIKFIVHEKQINHQVFLMHMFDGVAKIQPKIRRRIVQQFWSHLWYHQIWNLNDKIIIRSADQSEHVTMNQQKY